MASRTIRCFKTLSRLLLSSSKSHLHNLKSPPPPPLLHSFFSTQLQNPTPSNLLLLPHIRHFTSHDSEEGETDDDDEEEEEEEDGLITKADINRTYSLEEMKEEAAAIGYKVIGPLDPTERPFKYREPFFAVIQIGSHQFKVSNGDTIYTEKLKFCEVNDKLILDKVLMVGSKSQTIIGRPILPDAAVHAVVEEHALDAKVIIFKKKRRKNYRRTKGHRQELTRLRITDIEGIEKPEKVEKPDKVEKPGRVAVTA